jgi:filamentous hemagglutinin family protein
MAAGNALAGPEGAQVVGGAGNISQSGLTTTINQSTQNMAINWQSYNVSADERVQYIQPNSSSISLNRILSNNGSTIAGRIDANGQVILVNPNGIFFTPTSVVNVGGIIASGLDIAPSDFMNGNYIFNEVLGTDGKVINNGTINASLGGNVALMGKQVENDGLIVANLGTVSLAAGKQAVLTFDNGGLLGVRVSKEILQDELGVDPAVMNGGEIHAEGGRVLLTASTSQDVFSQAVNTAGLDQATSVVVNEDGSFTLGSGADVVNSGTIDTSTTSSDQNVGRIVLLGENVTSSGELRADAASGNAGEIELHAQDKTLLTGSSVTSVHSEKDGKGGTVKVLGDKVGLFDAAAVNATGANGGGQALIGGDYQGKNEKIRNATTTVIGTNAKIQADAGTDGNGGTVVVWANQNTYFLGGVSVRGGSVTGDGGLVEVSGKENLMFDGEVDLGAHHGQGGTLLLDPRDITIVGGDSNRPTLDNNELTPVSEVPTYGPLDLTVLFYDSSSSDFDITASRIALVLESGNVELQARRDIIVNQGITANSGNTNTLILRAGDDVLVNQDIDLKAGALSITAGNTNCGGSCLFGGSGAIYSNIEIAAGANLLTTGTISLAAGNDVTIDGGVGSVSERPSSLVVNADRDIVTGTSSSITANGSVTLSADVDAVDDGNVTLHSPINTGNGNFQASGVNYTATSTTGNPVTITTGTGDATIDMNGYVKLGGMVVGGTLDVTARGVSSNVSISQGTAVSDNDFLDVTGTSTFTSITGASEGDINLTNANNLRNAINLSTTGTYLSDINLNNTATAATTTTLNNVTVAGNLTVNARQDLTVSGMLTASGTDGDFNGARTTGVLLSFGQGASGTFSASGATIGTGTLNDDIVNIAISGGVNGDSFVLGDASISTGQGDITINGNAGADIIDVGTATVNAVSGNVTVSGGDDGDTLTLSSANVSASGTVAYNGDAGDDIFNLPISLSSTINGGDDNDTFDIQDDDVTATIDGGSGGTNADRVIANDSSNTNVWSIEGNGSGTLQNTGTVTFTNIENLTGGTGVDEFILASGGSLTGIIDGGASAGTTATDTMQINTDGTTVQLLRDAAQAPAGSRVNVTGVETITAYSASSNPNIIYADNVANTWTIDGAATSRVAPTTGAEADNTVKFVNFSELNGGSAEDVFAISSGQSWTINGGDGADQFNISASYSGGMNGGVGADTFRLSATGLTLGSSIDGGADNDEFIAANETNYWTISGQDSGSLFVDTILRAEFASVESVTGNDSADEFLIGASGGISQVLSGGADTNNTLIGRDSGNEWSITGSNTGVLYIDNYAAGFGTAYVNSFSGIQNVTGGGAADQFVIGDAGSVSGTLDGAGGPNVLVGRNTANEWDVNVADGGRLYDDNNADGFGSAYVNTFANIQTLIGGSAEDRFVMGLSGSVATIDGGSATGNTLVARQGVTNIWNFTDPTSGSLEQVDPVVVPSIYVDDFSNIQAFVGGGGGNEWANFSTASAQTLNAGNFAGFVGIVGNADLTLEGMSGQNNTWLITGSLTVPASAPPAGSLDGTNDGLINQGQPDQLYFVDFSHLSGGNQVDTFTLEAGGDITGSVHGGAGNDVFNISTSVSATIFGDADVDNFHINTENLALNLDGGGDSDVLHAPVLANDWSLNAQDAISTLKNGAGTNSVNFTHMETLNGGTANDTFSFNVDPLTAGYTLADGGGTGVDTVSIATIGGTLSLSTFSGMERLIGNGDWSTLVGDTTNDWSITGANDGVVNGIEFIDFGNLTGGSGIDTFTVAAGASTVAIDGVGVGNTLTIASPTGDTVDWTIDGADTGTVTGRVTRFSNIGELVGSDGDDNFTLTGTAPSVSVFLYGGNGTNTLTGDDDVNVWTITGSNGGELNGMTFTNFSALIGGANTDTFTLNDITNFAGSINGGAGAADELLASNRSNVWTITGASTGTVTGLTSGFSNVEVLTGNLQQDTFTLNDTADFAGSISGGGGTADELRGGNRSNVWQITGATTGTVTGLTGSFSNVEILTGNALQDTFTLNDAANFSGSINGGGGTADELRGGNRINAWQITGTTTGTVTGLTGNFSNVEIITGNALQDTFNLSDTANFSGSIDGGGGTADELRGGNRANAWQITGTTTGTVSGLAGSFSNVEILTGNALQDTFTLNDTANFSGSINGGGGTADELRGGNRANAWQITGATTGTVSGLTSGFSNVEILTGNAQQDTFALNDSADFAGSINGGDGAADELRGGNRANAWQITGATTGTVSGLTSGFSNVEVLTGNAEQDTFTLNDSADFAGSINGGAGTADELRAGNRANSWQITGVNNTGVVTGITGTFSNVELLTGNNSQDNFSLHASISFAGDIDGGGGTNTLTGGARTNDWIIDAVDGGTVTGLGAGSTFANIQNLNGSSGNFNDTFVFHDGGSISGLINGGAQEVGGKDVVDMSALNADISVRIGVGQDIVGIEEVIGNNDGVASTTYNSELVGENNRNIWTISGTNSGSVDGVNFVNFNNLTGNSGGDMFVVESGGDITGMIDGGAPNRIPWNSVDVWTSVNTSTEDVLDLSQLAAVDTVIDTDFTNIELVIGNGGDSRLRSGQDNNDWLILGQGTGVVNATEFRDFNSIVGGGGNDTFRVQDAFGGSIDGGGGTGTDSIDYSAMTSQTVVLGGSLGISDIEQVIGNGAGFVMHGMDGAVNTWTITGQNFGSVSAGAENLTFINFHSLEGGNDIDNFIVTGDGSISGLISGGVGPDTLSIDLTGRTSSTGQINFDGGDEPGAPGDRITVTGPAGIYNETFRANQFVANLSDYFDQLAYSSNNASLVVNYYGVGTVTDEIGVNSLTIHGTGQGTLIQLGANSFTVSNSLSGTVDYAEGSKQNITVLADSGVGVAVTGAVHLPGNLSITANNLTGNVGAGITAGALILDSVGAVGSGTAPIATNVGELSVVNSGPVYIDEQNNLALVQVDSTGLVDINADGTVSSNAALRASGGLNINASGNIILSGDNIFSGALNFISFGDITLAGNNQISGPISLSEGNADSSSNNNTFTLNNVGQTILANVSVQNLDVTSTGDITDSGTIVSTGTATFESDRNVVLDDGSNDFNVVNLTGTDTAEIVDVNNIGLGSLNADVVSVTAGNQITDANGGVMNVTANSVILRASDGIGAGAVNVTFTGDQGAFSVVDTDAIETSTANLSVINEIGGTVNINNNSNVTIRDLRNHGDIILTNTGAIDFAVTTAPDRLGAVDANYGGNVTDPIYAGDVAISGNGLHNVTTQGFGMLESDITAESLLVNGVTQFGTQERPIRLRVNRQFTLLSSGGAVTYPSGRPANVTAPENLITMDGSMLFSGQQLIDIESLGEVDEAIFTEVRNYYYDDVAIMMPADQRMTDDDDEEERRRHQAVN